MKNKNIAITIILTLIVGVLLFITNTSEKLKGDATSFYQVYLNGKKLGVIDNKEELYELIDQNQSEIKSKYGVETVYPPTDLKIIESHSYLAKLDNVTNIYEKIEAQDDFAVQGYVVHIKSDDKNYDIHVLDKEVFYKAARRFVNAFLGEDEYNQYINETQPEIVDTGRIIDSMKFLENITITEEYISVNDTIYTNDVDLVQFLLFGSSPESKSYTVKLGDTIESISDANKLNVEEFLIANTKYKTADSLLRVGDTVNVTLIDPQLTFVYELSEVKDEIAYYTKEKVADNTKFTTYSEITTPGQNGINRVKERYSVTNGERSQGVEIVETIVLREVINQITTYGTKQQGGGIGTGGYHPVITTGDWAWTTNQGYVITSYRGWRWGNMHQGIDISGAGNFGSPIYAAGDGVVTATYNGCPSRGNGYGDRCGGYMGNNITIDHGNGYTSRYGHLHQTLNVTQGQTVQKGQVIGYMGNSGSSTGIHLHFEVKYNGNYIDPLALYR